MKIMQFENKITIDGVELIFESTQKAMEFIIAFMKEVKGDLF